MAARARKVRLLLMDVDGVLTDGHVYSAIVAGRHGRGGEGVSFAGWRGTEDGARRGTAHGSDHRAAIAAVERRAQETGMEFVYQGYAEKIGAYEEILRVAGVARRGGRLRRRRFARPAGA